ncbi:signal peptidase II [Cohnella kolymensis]|uniref:Lipoprotein signal peptidase n=1 Tax=Cohnella kolymensis TaxID=1590652 RepID=A0ABR5A8I5_9BACL|nr:signal peptidase II [Cohnella kolymensis]KIL37309.1 signal peptidase II [Cohnella kolymensis]
MFFYVIAIFVVIIDQISKNLIRAYVDIGETTSFWGIPITHYENSGMASSLFQGYGRLFGVVAVVFVIVIHHYRRKGDIKGPLLDISFGFLVGGAVGNGIDRLLFGQVTDFLISFPSKGILNLSDHAIQIGVLLLILHGAIRLLKSLNNKAKAIKDESP